MAEPVTVYRGTRGGSHSRVVLSPVVPMTSPYFQFANGTYRVNLDYAHPEFLTRLMDLLADAASQGQEFYVTELYRSISRSDALYQAYLKGGPRAAPGGVSAHNYGIAADVCADASPDPGLQPSWDPKRYALLATLCPKHRLAWGGRFGDSPHIGLPGYESGKDLALLYQQYMRAQGDDLARLKYVWQTAITL